MSSQVETAVLPSVIEGEGIRITRQSIPIDSVSYEHLRGRFGKEFENATVALLSKVINKGVVTPHALVVKENEDGSLELLHKPGQLLALQHGGVTSLDVVVVHDKDFDLDKASFGQLLFLGEQGALIDHYIREVPLDDVITEGSIIDADVQGVLEEELAAGQKVPAWIRPRREGNRIVFDIVDGYHRSNALKKIGTKVLEARLSFGMTNEELADERVLAMAHSAKSVRFARVVSTMQESFHTSKWYLEYNLQLSQIFGLAVSSGKTKQPGKNLQIPEEIAREAIAWAFQKAEKWDSDVGSVYQQIHAADASFPEIIDQVRIAQGGGHAGDGILNPVKFIAMVDKLPGKLGLQRVMVGIIKKDNLNTDHVRVVAEALSFIENHPEAIQLVQSNPFDTEVLSSILNKKVTMEKGKFIVQEANKSTQGSDAGGEVGHPEDDTLSDDDDNSELVISVLDDLAPIDAIVEEATSDTIFQAPPPDTAIADAEWHEPLGRLKPTPKKAGEEDDIFPVELKPIKVVGAGRSDTPHHDYDKVRTATEYEHEINELKQTLGTLNEQLNRGGGSTKPWYETLASLSQQERDIMRRLDESKKANKILSEIDKTLMNRYNLTQNQLAQLKKSAVTKWMIFLSELAQSEYDGIVD